MTIYIQFTCNHTLSDHRRILLPKASFCSDSVGSWASWYVNDFSISLSLYYHLVQLGTVVSFVPDTIRLIDTNFVDLLYIFVWQWPLSLPLVIWSVKFSPISVCELIKLGLLVWCFSFTPNTCVDKPIFDWANHETEKQARCWFTTVITTSDKLPVSAYL